MWQRVDVSNWDVADIEQSGSSEAVWLIEPGSRMRWLHKDITIPANRVEQGEDWAEVISTEIARLLGLPRADTRVCVRNSRRGTLSRSIVPRGYDLWEGAVVLEGSRGFYRQIEGGPAAQDPLRPGVLRPGHTLSNIAGVLAGVAPPPEFAVEEVSAFDVFAGYLVLDALIANRDRHEQNWALLVPRLLGEPARLSPSYDHASSLAHNLGDQKRRTILGQKGALEKWASKGTASRFEHFRTAPTLVDHSAAAVDLSSDAGAEWLKGRLEYLDLSVLDEWFETDTQSGMSEVAATFARELLTLNLRRLRDVVGID